MPGRRGWIFPRYVASVSQSGLPDGCHAFSSAACRRCFSAWRARAPGACLATRPNFAASMRPSLETVTAHGAQASKYHCEYVTPCD